MASDLMGVGPTPSDEAPPLLDPVMLAELSVSVGADGLDALLAMVPETLTAELARLDAAMATGDADAARRAAHTVKGLAGNLGLARTYAAALTLDLALRTRPDTAAAADAHAALRDAGAATVAALAARTG